MVPRSRAAKRILISAIHVVGRPGVSDGRAWYRDFGERDARGARAATRLGEPAGCGCRPKEARAGVIVVMNVLNPLPASSGARRTRPPRHGHRADRCLRDLVFLHVPGGQVDVRRARRAKTRRRPARPGCKASGPGPSQAGLTLAWLAERLQLTADRSRKSKKAVESPVIKA